jgi:hypothetical protein
MKVSIGRTVLYKLTEQNVAEITRRRTTGTSIAARIQKGNTRLAKVEGLSVNVDVESWPLGAQAHIGNPHHVGQVLPLTVCVVWPNEYGPNYDGVNGQVLLDGNDTLWVTSIKEGAENGTWAWPVREDSAPKAETAV